MYSLSILYKIWTNACSCYGLAVRKRNCRWWAGQTAKNWRKPWLFLTTWDIATNWTYDNSLQTFIGCHGEKQWKCGGGGGRKQWKCVCGDGCRSPTISNSSVFTEMSAVSIRASFYRHDWRNGRLRKNGLGSISIATSLQASETIYPPPERIVWCYSQWQPAYTEMLVAMPHTGFVKGIPTALEQDSYFDVNKWNLIMFDDQMIDAS